MYNRLKNNAPEDGEIGNVYLTIKIVGNFLSACFVIPKVEKIFDRKSGVKVKKQNRSLILLFYL